LPVIFTVLHASFDAASLSSRTLAVRPRSPPAQIRASLAPDLPARIDGVPVRETMARSRPVTPFRPDDVEAPPRPAALDRSGAAMAHELKNPLTGVKALVQLGLRNPAEAASHERLALIEHEVARMQELVQSYLASASARAEAVSTRRVELGPLVTDTLRVVSARAADARVRLVARGDATVEADPRRLAEALVNLVANAIEATPPGGDVLVEVRPLEDAAEIAVRDTGRGMAPEALRRLGTPFFTTREGGTGLGVVLAHTVIARHGGSLRYESEPGKGTTVRATLPRRARGVTTVRISAAPRSR
jgi:two-component system, NtrC family, sensor histidine kinase HydH